MRLEGAGWKVLVRIMVVISWSGLGIRWAVPGSVEATGGWALVAPTHLVDRADQFSVVTVTVSCWVVTVGVAGAAAWPAEAGLSSLWITTWSTTEPTGRAALEPLSGPHQ